MGLRAPNRVGARRQHIHPSKSFNDDDGFRRHPTPRTSTKVDRAVPPRCSFSTHHGAKIPIEKMGGPVRQIRARTLTEVTMRASALYGLCALVASTLGCGWSGSRSPNDGGIGGSTTISGNGNTAGSGLVGGSSGAAGNTGTAGTAPTADANCGARTYGLQKVPPDILIVLDKSGSMNMDAMGQTCAMPTCSKWNEIPLRSTRSSWRLRPPSVGV